MIHFILILCFIWSITDNILTNLTLRKAKKYNIRGINNREWYEWELNPLIKRIYKNTGLNYGLIIAVCCSLAMLIVINFLFTEAVLFFALGALSIVIILHWDNLRAINRMVKKGNETIKKTQEYQDFMKVVRK